MRLPVNTVIHTTLVGLEPATFRSSLSQNLVIDQPWYEKSKSGQFRLWQSCREFGLSGYPITHETSKRVPLCIVSEKRKTCWARTGARVALWRPCPQLDREKIITRCRHSPTWPPNLPGAPGRPEVRGFHYFNPPIDGDIVKRSFCEPNPHTTVSSLHNIHLSSVRRSVRQYQATIHSTFWQFATITLTICYCYRLQ